MKKITFILLLLLALTSCEGPMGPEGPPGYGTNWKVIDITVNDYDWELIGTPDGINSYYRCIINHKNISEDVYYDGTLLIYQYQYLDGTEVQALLPFVIHVENNDGSHQWTETLSYDFTPGSIALYMNYSDFATKNRHPVTSDFRIVMMW